MSRHATVVCLYVLAFSITAVVILPSVMGAHPAVLAASLPGVVSIAVLAATDRDHYEEES